MEFGENDDIREKIAATGEMEESSFLIEEVFSEQSADFVISNADNKTDSEIRQEVENKIKKRCWWLDREWAEKGLPKEQIEVSIGEYNVTIYNFNSEIKFSAKHEKELAEVFSDYYREDPELFRELDYILINDRQKDSLLGNNEKFPLNGGCVKVFRSIFFNPRGMKRDIDFRVPGVSNFKGTAAHEMCHLEIKDRKDWGNNERRDKWINKFGWHYCKDYPDEWREIEIDSDRVICRNDRTKEIVFNNFTNKPELCLNDYTKTSYEEDICDSRVAYFYNPDSIKNICADKYEDVKEFGIGKKGNIMVDKNAEVSFKRIPTNEIKLPQKPRKTYTFYKDKSGDGLDMY